MNLFVFERQDELARATVERQGSFDIDRVDVMKVAADLGYVSLVAIKTRLAKTSENHLYPPAITEETFLVPVTDEFARYAGWKFTVWYTAGSCRFQTHKDTRLVVFEDGRDKVVCQALWKPATTAEVCLVMKQPFCAVPVTSFTYAHIEETV